MGHFTEIITNANGIRDTVKSNKCFHLLIDVLAAYVNIEFRSLAFAILFGWSRKKILKVSRKVKKERKKKNIIITKTLTITNRQRANNKMEIRTHTHARLYTGKWMESCWVCCWNTNTRTTTQKQQRTHTGARTHDHPNYTHIWLNCAHVYSHHLYVTYKII